MLAYALLLYMMAVVLVPRGMKDLDDSFEYFMSGRRWFFAVLMLASTVDVVDTAFKGRDWVLRPEYFVFEATSITVAIVGMRAKSRRIHLALAVLMLGYQVIYTWVALFVLGRW